MRTHTWDWMNDKMSCTVCDSSKPALLLILLPVGPERLRGPVQIQLTVWTLASPASRCIQPQHAVVIVPTKSKNGASTLPNHSSWQTDDLSSKSAPPIQGRNDGAACGAQFPGHRITTGSVEWLRGTPKSPNNITSAFFNTVHILPITTSNSNVGVQTSLPRAPSNLVTPCSYSLVKLILKAKNWLRYFFLFLLTTTFYHFCWF